MYSWRMRSSGAQEFSCCALLPQDALPYNDYFEYYGPDYRLHMPVSNMENLNTPEYLEANKVKLFDILKQVEAVPGVHAAGSNVAPPALEAEKPDDETKDPNVRDLEQEKEHPAEFEPPEKESMDTSST